MRDTDDLNTPMPGFENEKPAGPPNPPPVRRKKKKVVKKKVAKKKSVVDKDALRDTLTKLLAPFRKPAEEAVTFLEHQVVRQLCAGWLTYSVAWDPTDRDCPYERDTANRIRPTTALWEWIWKGIDRLKGPAKERFFKDFAQHCGVSVEDVGRWFPVLVGNRLIFPDNTVSESVTVVIKLETGLRYRGRGR